jgi:hypothetical protein
MPIIPKALFIMPIIPKALFQGKEKHACGDVSAFYT